MKHHEQVSNKGPKSVEMNNHFTFQNANNKYIIQNLTFFEQFIQSGHGSLPGHTAVGTSPAE